jgi:hypothetical protein
MAFRKKRNLLYKNERTIFVRNFSDRMWWRSSLLSSPQSNKKRRGQRRGVAESNGRKHILPTYNPLLRHEDVFP